MIIASQPRPTREDCRRPPLFCRRRRPAMTGFRLKSSSQWPQKPRRRRPNPSEPITNRRAPSACWPFHWMDWAARSSSSSSRQTADDADLGAFLCLLHIISPLMQTPLSAPTNSSVIRACRDPSGIAGAFSSFLYHFLSGAPPSLCDKALLGQSAPYVRT